MYSENLTSEEDNLIFEYLYHLSKMLAFKSKFFNKNQYYEDFAIYLATDVYFRIKNPKQFEIDEIKGAPKLSKIKSSLNYLKSVLYPRKIAFEQNAYSQVMSKPADSDIVEYYPGYSFSDMLSDSVDDMSIANFNLYLGDLGKTARAFLSNIPYKIDSVE